MLPLIKLTSHGEQACGAEAVVVAGADILQLRLTQHHCLALAQQNRTGLALKPLAAALAVFGFVFGFHILAYKIFTGLRLANLPEQQVLFMRFICQSFQETHHITDLLLRWLFIKL